MKRLWLIAIGAGAVAAGTFGVVQWRHHASANAPGCTRAVYANEAIVCAEQPDGFWCWGFNDQNGLGDPKFKVISTPTRVAFPHKGLVSLSMRYQSGAAIDHGHALYWGRDIDSWLGEPGQHTHPEPIRLRDFPDDLVQIRTGEWFLCAKRRSGQLYCRYKPEDHPALGFQVILPGPVEQFAVSQYLACALQGGHVYCWGPDEPWASWPPKAQANGKLAITPKPLAGFSGIAKQVSVDYSDAYVLRRDGSLWAIGGNQFGDLGIGTHDTRRKTPPSHPLVQVEHLGNTVVKVASGANFSCALVRDGSVYCWGYDEHGQAGPKYTEVHTTDSTVKAALAPQRIGDLDHDNADIVLSNDFACSIKRNHSLWCWGGADIHVGPDDACTGPDAPPKGCRPARVPLVCPK